MAEEAEENEGLAQLFPSCLCPYSDDPAVGTRVLIAYMRSLSYYLLNNINLLVL